MPSEKELNCMLFDHLFSLQRIEKAARKGGIEAVKEVLTEEINNVETKLYQNPPSQPKS